jgi:8-oxo-dGTP diphosphatase
MGRYLLLKRSVHSRFYAGEWEFPGGKINPGEKLDEALLREIEEETGLKVSLERVAGSAEAELPAARVAYLIFEAKIESGQVRLSKEHDDFAWAAPEDMPTFDLVKQFRAIAQLHSQTRPVHENNDGETRARARN